VLAAVALPAQLYTYHDNKSTLKAVSCKTGSVIRQPVLRCCLAIAHSVMLQDATEYLVLYGSTLADSMQHDTLADNR
jgi:hypothetical protein